MTDLERIARELCLNDGYFPDDLVIMLPMPNGPRGLPVLYSNNVPTPCWTLYEPYARATLTMVMSGAEHTDLRALIAEILSGAEIDDEPEPENPDAPPPPKNWRERYHLQPIK